MEPMEPMKPMELMEPMEPQAAEVRIQPFFDGEGRLLKLPRRRDARLAALAVLAEAFEVGREYTEPEVNRIVDERHTFGDYFLLRRELVDHGFLCRTASGSRYWRAAKG